MKIGLLVACHNRPGYLRECLDSLGAIDLTPGVHRVLLVDDGSTDIKVDQQLSEFVKEYGGTSNLRYMHPKGIKHVIREGFEVLADVYGCDVLVNLDSDAIVKPDFLTRLLDLHQRFPDKIISGFNPGRDVIAEHEDYVIRSGGNGINMCMSADTYRRQVLPALSSPGNWDWEATKGTEVIVTRPSVVQHIGYKSSMGHTGADVACDFKRISLPAVTLFGIDGRNPQGIMKAAEISQRDIQFGDVVVITEKLFEGHANYSKFCIERMVDYIKTPHFLVIHADGYVVNWKAWRDEWLQYDYIGAPWEWYDDDYKNGNGGFSLRSKRLHEILRRDPHIKEYHPEDHIIGRTYRDYLEQHHGIKFAPDDTCRQFSIEAYGVKPPGNRYQGQFGFHGHNVDFRDADIAHIPKLNGIQGYSAAERAKQIWEGKQKIKEERLKTQTFRRRL